MAVAQRFSIAALLLWISIISYRVPEVSGVALVCNVEMGALAKCNDAISKLPAKSPISPPSPRAPPPARPPPTSAPAPASPPQNPSDDDANLPVLYSPAVAPSADDSSTDAFLTDEASGAADHAADARAACCGFAFNANLGCLCGFMSAPMLIDIKFAGGFVNTLAEMCNIHVTSSLVAGWSC